jgi:hypothetical protein
MQRSYSIYIHDDRYSVPTLLFVVADADERARELATQRLAESAHYTGIDVHHEDTLLFSLKADAGRGQAEGR